MTTVHRVDPAVSAYAAADWVVRQSVPRSLRSARCDDLASLLEGLRPLDSWEACCEAEETLSEMGAILKIDPDSFPPHNQGWTAAIVSAWEGSVTAAWAAIRAIQVATRVSDLTTIRLVTA